MDKSIDNTKSYPWPTIPRKTPISVNDILDDLRANIAAKPARDAKARAAAGPAKPFVRPTAQPAAPAAPAFSQTPITAKEIKPNG
jgi:hypothetical protein